MPNSKLDIERKSNKRRLSIPLSLDIYNKICNDADKMGISPSTYGSIIIGNHYKSLDFTQQSMENALRDGMSKILQSYGLTDKDISDSMEEGHQALRDYLLKNKE